MKTTPKSLLHRIAFTFLSVFLATAMFSELYAKPSADEYATILNLSGKQRMLSQKMTKEMLLIEADVNPKVNLKNLALSAKLFKRTIIGLKTGDSTLKLPETTSEPILDQLAVVNAIWSEYSAVVEVVLNTQKVTQEQIATIAKINVPLLVEMNKCVNLYENEAKAAGMSSQPELAVAINLAGKQRMLIQKMCKEFLLVSLGHDIEVNQQNLHETSQLFEQTLKGLIDGDESLGLIGTHSELIVGQLQAVEKTWTAFEPIIAKADEPSNITHDDIEKLASMNLPLLKYMNKVVGYFERSESLKS